MGLKGTQAEPKKGPRKRPSCRSDISRRGFPAGRSNLFPGGGELWATLSPARASRRAASRSAPRRLLLIGMSGPRRTSLVRGTTNVGRDRVFGRWPRSRATPKLRSLGGKQREAKVNASSRDHQRKATTTRCAQCHCLSGLYWRGWRAYRTDDLELDEPSALAFFCPTCAGRVFGNRT
jgi:hypothetical protein